MMQQAFQPSSLSSGVATLIEPKPNSASGVTVDRVGDLVVRFQYNRSPDLYSEIAHAMLPTIRDVARRIHARAGFPNFVDRDDLVQLGSIGLLGAVNSFKPSLGAKFATFAGMRIQGAMLDGLRAQDPLSRRERTIVRKFYRANEELKSEGVLRPSLEEIEARTGLSKEEVRVGSTLVAAPRVRHLEGLRVGSQGPNTDLRGERARSSAEAVPDLREVAVDHRSVVEDMWRTVRRCLSPQEGRVFELIVRHGVMPGDIARELGVSEVRVSRLKQSALATLRSVLIHGNGDSALLNILRTELGVPTGTRSLFTPVTTASEVRKQR
jgi:RNA polymerase sigma factor for flagellar operon FliA